MINVRGWEGGDVSTLIPRMEIGLRDWAGSQSPLDATEVEALVEGSTRSPPLPTSDERDPFNSSPCLPCMYICPC